MDHYIVIYILICLSIYIYSEEQLTSIAERTIVEADENGDGMISLEEFCKVLERTDVEQKMSIRFLS